MAVYKIVEIGDPILREKARPIKTITPNIHKLLKNMADTLYQAEGFGLAAPQIGISKRVIVMDVGDGLIELINPEIVWSEGEQVGNEGCLSVPGVTREVSRAMKVKAEGLDRNGKPVAIEGEGLLARCLQHEIDHLEGILFVDRSKKKAVGRV
ncbi:MAG: peptide deformylase [Firmicutes bacterium]|nr:peptide deformylase [Bacillota bacterium]